ncbi:MAG: hypothetical protein ACPGQ5_07715 [Alphaproteobacteria bacterium]
MQRQFTKESFIMSLHTHSHIRSEQQSVAVHCFSVRAIADPGMMPRLMELWAKRGLVPDRWHGVRDEADGGHVDIDIESGQVDGALAMQMAAAMRATFGVSHVLLSEKRTAVCA